MIVKLEFTLEQAELCKAALLTVPLSGRFTAMVTAIETIHGTIKILDEAIAETKRAEAEAKPSQLHEIDDLFIG